jgi:hypothetical protein
MIGSISNDVVVAIELLKLALMEILDMVEHTLAFDEVPKDNSFRSSSHELLTACANEVGVFSCSTLWRHQRLMKAANNQVIYRYMRSNSNSKNRGIRRP